MKQRCKHVKNVDGIFNIYKWKGRIIMNREKKFGIVILIFLCVCLVSGYFIFCRFSENDAESKGVLSNVEGQELEFEMHKKETAAAQKMQRIQSGLLAGTLTREDAAKEIRLAKEYLEKNFGNFCGNEEFLELLYYSAFLQDFWENSGNGDAICQNELISMGIKMHNNLVDFYSNGLESKGDEENLEEKMKLVSDNEISELIDLIMGESI